MRKLSDKKINFSYPGKNSGSSSIYRTTKSKTKSNEIFGIIYFAKNDKIKKVLLLHMKSARPFSYDQFFTRKPNGLRK